MPLFCFQSYRMSQFCFVPQWLYQICYQGQMYIELVNFFLSSLPPPMFRFSQITTIDLKNNFTMKNSNMLKSRENIILNTHVWQKASPIVSILPFFPLIFFLEYVKADYTHHRKSVCISNRSAIFVPDSFVIILSLISFFSPVPKFSTI